MNTSQPVHRYYKEQLERLGHQITDLSRNDQYIERLIDGDDLLPFDEALRVFIEQFRQ